MVVDFLGSACGGAAPAGQSFILTNAGTLPAQITGATFTGYAGYATDANGKSVPANGGTLTVHLTASGIPATSAVPGNYAATLTITTNIAGDSPHQVQLTQEAMGAILAFDTSPTGASFGAFGNVAAGVPANQNFNIVNSGNAPATGVAVTTTTPFSVQTSSFGSLGVGSQPDVVTFTPTGAGGSASTLSLTGGNLCAPPPSAISLGGTGQAGGISLSTQSVSFATPCGTTSGTKTFTVTNSGNQPMSWTAALGVGTQYTMSVTDINGTPVANTPGTSIGSTMLNSGDVATVTVVPAAMPQYPPSSGSPSTFVDSISITTDIVNDTTHHVSLSDTPLGDVLLWQPASLNFQDVSINQASAPQTVYVVNYANPGSPVANVQVASGAPSVFALTNSTFTLASNQASGQIADVGVTFDAPGSPGPQGSSLTINTGTDVLCSPLPNPITVSGTATEAGPAVNPQVLVFGNPANGLVNCGAQAPALQVTVTDTGNQNFNITGLSVDNTTYFQTPTMNSMTGLVQANGGNSVTVTVTPNPMATAVAAANLKTSCLAGACPMFSGNMTITTNANTPTPNLVVPLYMGAQGVVVSNALTVTTWNYPTRNVGQQAQLSIGITNDGNAPLQVGMQGLTPGVFSLSPSNPSPELVTPGGLNIVSIFSPDAAHSNYIDSATITVSPTSGNVFCEPLPPSWNNPTITLQGSSN